MLDSFEEVSIDYSQRIKGPEGVLENRLYALREPYLLVSRFYVPFSLVYDRTRSWLLKPRMMRAVVDFPQPLSPARAYISAGFMLNDTLSTAVIRTLETIFPRVKILVR